MYAPRSSSPPNSNHRRSGRDYAVGITGWPGEFAPWVKPFSADDREQFLAAKHVAVLSVADPTGQRPPASAPIWYDYQPGGLIRINTGANSRKFRLIEQVGVVTLVVQREELPYQYVVVEGTVVDTITPSPREAREEIAVRYLGAEDGPAFVDSLEEQDSALFHIRPDRWITADFSDAL